MTGATCSEGVQISVTDQGPGFRPESLEEAFNPFFTTKTHGLGLGLSVCRTIISAHGGKMWAANQQQGGATVHLTLPVLSQERP